MRLDQMIGETLIGEIPGLSQYFPGLSNEFKLLSVDVGGIWIENQTLTELFLKEAQRVDASESPAFFLPFSSIHHLARLHDSPALSEKALGLEPA